MYFHSIHLKVMFFTSFFSKASIAFLTFTAGIRPTGSQVLSSCTRTTIVFSSSINSLIEISLLSIDSILQRLNASWKCAWYILPFSLKYSVNNAGVSSGLSESCDVGKFTSSWDTSLSDSDSLESLTACEVFPFEELFTPIFPTSGKLLQLHPQVLHPAKAFLGCYFLLHSQSTAKEMLSLVTYLPWLWYQKSQVRSGLGLDRFHLPAVGVNENSVYEKQGNHWHAFLFATKKNTSSA